LISVDLPAPLVPITECTVPRRTATETSSTAFSPPKLRDTFRARSSTSPAASGMAPPSQVRDAPDELLADADDAVGHQCDAGDDREAEGQLPVLGQASEDRFLLEQLLQQRERERADHRAA